MNAEVDSRSLVRPPPPRDLPDERRNCCWTCFETLYGLRISLGPCAQLWRRTVLGLGWESTKVEPSVDVHLETDSVMLAGPC